VTSILWRRLDRPGHEAARLEGTRLVGAAAFVHDGQPCALAYRVDCDEAWRTRSAHVRGFVGERAIDVLIDVDGGRWLLNGAEVEAVRGCVDVDFNFSPSTNLLPIRRGAIGVPVVAAWLRFPSFALEPLEQSYERIGERVVRYASATGFTADIEVNEDGLPVHYPGFVVNVLS
jgi:uncharacterized protein